MSFSLIGKSLGAFARDDEGVISIEYVIWVCYMVGLFCLSADATLLMHQKSVLYDAARDASRQVASGQKTNVEAEALILERFGGNAAYAATVTSSNGFVTATITVPFSEVTVFGDNFTGDAKLVGNVSMWIES